jgi:hypothetical protein
MNEQTGQHHFSLMTTEMPLKSTQKLAQHIQIKARKANFKLL